MLNACGGGGGSSGDSSDDSGGGGITYTGNADPAVITTTNAATLVTNVMGAAATSDAVSASRVSTTAPSQLTGQAHLARRLSQLLLETPVQTVAARSAELRSSAKIDLDETDSCESGSIRIVGTLNDDGTGTVTASFNSCRFGDETFNGQATVRIDAFDLGLFIITDATFSFSTLTLTTPTLSASLSGSIRSQVTIGTNTEQLIVNMVTLDNASGHMTKTENLVVVDVFNNVLFPSSFTETLTGRGFDSVHGFVDITTIVPLVFSTINQSFPDDGQVLLTGTGNTSIRITSVSASVVILELDLDGDGSHERVATLRWVEINDEAGLDLADSDGDGMHDSWELANGLDPADATDADRDADSDGFSNANEYLTGSDPNNAGSPVLFAVRQQLNATKLTRGARFGSSVAVDGDTALVGARGESFDPGTGNLDEAGAIYVFTRNGNTWTQQQRLIADQPAAGDWFGVSVALDGDTALIGASARGGLPLGSAYVFTRTGTTWTQQQRLDAVDEIDDGFGSSVALHGDTALIGAYHNTRTGSAHVFTRVGTTWTLQQRLTAAGAVVNAELGSSVALEGDTALVGAWGDDFNTINEAGAAYVFTRAGTTWTQQQRLDAADPTTGKLFGSSVALSGDSALIGSSGGAAYVFTRPSTTWTQQQRLDATAGATRGSFGSSVALDGDTALVSAPLEDLGPTITGAGYIFKRAGTTWTQFAKLEATLPLQGAEFGFSVALDGNTALVGEWNANCSSSRPGSGNCNSGDVFRAGSAYVFTPDVE